MRNLALTSRVLLASPLASGEAGSGATGSVSGSGYCAKGLPDRVLRSPGDDPAGKRAWR